MTTSILPPPFIITDDHSQSGSSHPGATRTITPSSYPYSVDAPSADDAGSTLNSQDSLNPQVFLTSTALNPHDSLSPHIVLTSTTINPKDSWNPHVVLTSTTLNPHDSLNLHIVLTSTTINPHASLDPQLGSTSTPTPFFSPLISSSTTSTPIVIPPGGDKTTKGPLHHKSGTPKHGCRRGCGHKCHIFCHFPCLLNSVGGPPGFGFNDPDDPLPPPGPPGVRPSDGVDGGDDEGDDNNDDDNGSTGRKKPTKSGDCTKSVVTDYWVSCTSSGSSSKCKTTSTSLVHGCDITAKTTTTGSSCPIGTVSPDEDEGEDGNGPGAKTTKSVPKFTNNCMACVGPTRKGFNQV